MAEEKKFSDEDVLRLLENFGDTLERLAHTVTVEREINGALVALAHASGWNIQGALDMMQTVAAQKSAESPMQERLYAAYNARVTELLANLGRKAN